MTCTSDGYSRRTLFMRLRPWRRIRPRRTSSSVVICTRVRSFSRMRRVWRACRIADDTLGTSSSVTGGSSGCAVETSRRQSLDSRE